MCHLLAECQPPSEGYPNMSSAGLRMPCAEIFSGMGTLLISSSVAQKDSLCRKVGPVLIPSPTSWVLRIVFSWNILRLSNVRLFFLYFQEGHEFWPKWCVSVFYVSISSLVLRTIQTDPVTLHLPPGYLGTLGNYCTVSLYDRSIHSAQCPQGPLMFVPLFKLECHSSVWDSLQ